MRSGSAFQFRCGVGRIEEVAQYRHALVRVGQQEQMSAILEHFEPGMADRSGEDLADHHPPTRLH